MNDLLTAPTVDPSGDRVTDEVILKVDNISLSFGGVKASGHGIPESGKTGIEFFTEHKVAFINYL